MPAWEEEPPSGPFLEETLSKFPNPDFTLGL